jgi:hypothetical protein
MSKKSLSEILDYIRERIKSNPMDGWSDEDQLNLSLSRQDSRTLLEEIERLQKIANMVTLKNIFTFLDEVYVQSADARQKDMGLQYMTAETHDLAKIMTRFLRSSTLNKG